MYEELFKPLQIQLLSIFSHFNLVNALEILLIVLVVGIFYKKYIHHTQSEKLVRGIMFLFLAWIFSEILSMLNLTILGMFLKLMVTLIALSLIVIFQPELRRFLGYLGQPGFFSKTLFGINQHNSYDRDNDVDIIKELIESVKYLTKTKTGALIVFQSDINPGAYSEVGTRLNADVSAELILTVFHPNTPLHDGAMVIKDNKILSAGVLLPLTENPKLSWKYGTRHRAAIGMTEVSDSACLVVSEETGDVSICMDGTLKKYDDLVTLKEDLAKILHIENEVDEKKNRFFNFNNFGRKS